jgi:exoribonuclease R
MIGTMLWQGTLRVNRYNTNEGWVASESVGQDILISGRIDMNRAFDGDAIAVELLPEDQWRSPDGAARWIHGSNCELSCACCSF